MNLAAPVSPLLRGRGESGHLSMLFYRARQSLADENGCCMQDMSGLRDENRRLRRAVDELSILNELASTIGALNDFEDVVRKIINRSIRATDAEQGVITLVEEQPEQPARTLVRTTISSAGHERFHLDQTLLGWMIINKRPIALNDPCADERFRGIPWNSAVRSVVCVPMLIRSALKGILTLYNKQSGTGFTEDDQRLLAIIASQSAQVVENARLYEEERALVQIQHEMKLASQIQADLLPKEMPRLPGYDIAGATFPARIVGGDYFDLISIDENKTAICLGDVAGKGLPAALLAANLQATLRGETQPLASVAECIRRLNCRLYRSTGPEKFATLFYGILDAAAHTLTYCDAGQEPPFILKRGKGPARLREGGSLIGIADELPFEEANVSLDEGDILVIYSDGVTEAMDCNRGQFGETKLLDVVTRNAGLSARQLIDSIVSAIREHAGGAQQHDDITAVVVKRSG